MAKIIFNVYTRFIQEEHEISEGPRNITQHSLVRFQANHTVTVS